PAVRERAGRTLAAQGRESVAALGRVLREAKDLAARQHAAWALAAIPDAAALPPLRQALRDDSADLAATAARALGRRGDRAAAAGPARPPEAPAPRRPPAPPPAPA